MSEARQHILDRLRRALRERPAFPQSHTLPHPHLPVTPVQGDRRAWLEQFGQHLEQLGGSWEYADSIAGARLSLLTWFQTEGIQRVLAWAPEQIPLPGLPEALASVGVELIVPDFRRGNRIDTLKEAAEVDLGVTGAVAALASTATLVVRSGPGFSRLASLITPRHLALVPMSRLYPNLEAWLAELRAAGHAREFFADTSNIVFISGPSRTADIEMTLTLGVHGPRQVNVLFFEER